MRRFLQSWSLRLLIFIILPCLLLGCHSQGVSAKDVLSAICEEEVSLPAGVLYWLSSEEERERPSDALLAAAFGEGSPPSSLFEVEDAAFFFSYTQTCEFSVFLCKRASETDAVAKMCLRRLEQLKNAFGKENLPPALKSATVVTRGRWVLLCVSTDAENALRAFRRAI